MITVKKCFNLWIISKQMKLKYLLIYSFITLTKLVALANYLVITGNTHCETQQVLHVRNQPITCCITTITHHHICSTLLVLLLHISSSIYFHWSTFYSFSPINISTWSNASAPYTAYRLRISCSSLHSMTKCLKVSSSPPQIRQSTAPPSRPCLHLSLRVFVLH